MKLKTPKINQATTTCCWCEHKIGSDGPIYTLGCKKRPEVDISKYEGKVMPAKITSSGKTMWAIVPPADSDAVTRGNDFVFTLCSEECGDQLKETLDVEKELGDLIFSAEHIY